MASSDYLHRFNKDGTEIWKSPQPGLDGVIVSNVKKGVIEGSVEWDPPGGWEYYKLSLGSGRKV